MATNFKELGNSDSQRYRVVKVGDRVVRVNVVQAKKAMKRAMEVYSENRTKDAERDNLLKLNGAK